MTRMFNVSNRVVVPEPGQNVAGGLDNTLLSCKGFDTIVRLGYSGTLIPDAEYHYEDPARYHVRTVQRTRDDGRSIVYHLLDLPEEHYHAFYEHTANGDLWNIFHGRPDLVSGDNESRRLSAETTEIYVKAMDSLIEHDDESMIHDYHFMQFARKAREAGMERPLGLFMHIPLPDQGIVTSLDPETQQYVRELMTQDLFAFDMVGLQAPRDLGNWESVLGDFGNEPLDVYQTRFMTNGNGGNLKVGVFPATGDSIENKLKVKRMLETGAANKFLHMATDGRIKDGVKPEELQLIVGADRIDPSKALPKRMHALTKLFDEGRLDPATTAIIQAAAQSREAVPGYREEIESYRQAYTDLRLKHGAIAHSPNDRGKFTPLDQGSIFVAYSQAAVGIFTSDIDGMHLGPKELTDVSNPENPAACLMTRTIGAAHEFKDCAVIVEPTVEGIAEGIEIALQMPKEQRIEQHQERARIMDENNNERWITSLVRETHDHTLN